MTAIPHFINMLRKRHLAMRDSDPPFTFARFLKFWRSVHTISQEYLATLINVSPRHISRLENGISRPSLRMVNEISAALSLGQRDSNHLLIAAGFLPNMGELDFHAPELNWLRKAMRLSLKALDPYPAMIVDDSKNILMLSL